MAPLPKKLKPITAFIRRAEELDKVGDEQTQIIAYYCREYAAEQGVRLSEDCDDPEVAVFLGGLIGRLESDKAKLSNETDFTREDAAKICVNFANNVFIQADEEDRAGLADKETAKQFYVAGNIYDIMQQFGELDEEVAKKKKYAKFKASDIISMIKQGRKPTPGGPGEDLITGMPVGVNGNDQQFPEMPTSPLVHDAQPPLSPSPELGQDPPGGSRIPTAPFIQTAVTEHEQHNVAPVYQPLMEVSPVPSPNSAQSRPSREQREDAIECCRFAIAALEHKDVNLAVQRLHSALDVLGRK